MHGALAISEVRVAGPDSRAIRWLEAHGMARKSTAAGRARLLWCCNSYKVASGGCFSHGP
jgi:hypothetical protein